MVKNLSYNSKKNRTILFEIVGRAFSLIERIRLKGIGSGKLIIIDASEEIIELLKLDNNINYCNIELRTNGIIIRFRSLLETYGLIIPYYKLVIYKGESNIYSFYKDNYYIKFMADNKKTSLFVKKIVRLKIKFQNKVGFN
tara:strand:- start:74 stop:496 length:423 start_codon:yes stop_codon:yes gene_type:complete